MPLPPPLKSIVVNGKKKVVVNGVVNLNIPQGGGGGTQVQPDWNQNDENAPDFIKNRICIDETNRIFEDSILKFNENAQLDITIESNNAVILPRDWAYIKSLSELVNITTTNCSITNEGKDGIIEFNIIDSEEILQGQFQIYISYIFTGPDTGYYQYKFTGGANPAYAANLEFIVYLQRITKLIDGRMIKVDNTTIGCYSDGSLGVNQNVVAFKNELGGAFFDISGDQLLVSVDKGKTWKIVRTY